MLNNLIIVKVRKMFYSLTKRKTLFLVLIFVFLGLIFPRPAQAFFPAIGWLGWVLVSGMIVSGGMFISSLFETKIVESTIAAFLTGFFVGILQIPLAIANFFFALSILALSAVTQPDFIKFSYTGLDNPIISAGWTITRDLTNIGIVLGLVIIALATIFRIESYQAKKTLPILIIVALLINFTPVILGVIVDFANIVMRHLLGDYMNFQAMADPFGKQLEILTGPEGFQGTTKTGNLPNVYRDLGMTVVLIVFGLVAGFVFFIFTALFVLRHILIWMLVILSPLAFFCYILPGTRGIAAKWWKEFLNWCFVGVSAAFFLYLSMKLLEKSGGLLGAPIESSPGAERDIGLINALLPHGVIIAFLIVGLIATLSISAMGAQTAIKLTRKGGRAFGGWTGKQTLGRFAASETGKDFFKEMTKGRITPTFREAKGFLGKTLAGAETLSVAPVRWALRYAGKKGLEYGAAMPKDIDKKVGDLEGIFGKDVDRAASTYKTIPATEWQNKIALAQYLAKTKGAKGLEKLDEKELKEVAKLTAGYAPKKLEDIVKHKPELIEDAEVGTIIQKIMVDKGLSKDKEGKYEDEDVAKLIELGYEGADAIRKAAFKKAVDAMKNEDVENLAISTIKNSDFQEMAIRFKSTSFIRKIGEEKGSEYIALLQQKAEKLTAEEIAKTNFTLLNSAVTNPGFRAIFPAIKGAETKEELKKLLEKIKKTSSSPPATPPTTPTPPSPSSPADTGEGGKKERKEPDVGKL